MKLKEADLAQPTGQSTGQFIECLIHNACLKICSDSEGNSPKPTLKHVKNQPASCHPCVNRPGDDMDKVDKSTISLPDKVSRISGGVDYLNTSLDQIPHTKRELFREDMTIGTSMSVISRDVMPETMRTSCSSSLSGNTILTCNASSIASCPSQPYFLSPVLSHSSTNMQPCHASTAMLVAAELSSRNIAPSAVSTVGLLSSHKFTGEENFKGIETVCNDDVDVDNMKHNNNNKDDVPGETNPSTSGAIQIKKASENELSTPNEHLAMELVESLVKNNDVTADSLSNNTEECEATGSDVSGLRKSKRSNRGQRYQKLISEGLLSPARPGIRSSKSDSR